MAFYPLTLEPDEGTVLVTSPAFSELITFGEDRDDALFRAQSALFVALAGRILHNEEIPAPLDRRPATGESIEVPALIYLKTALYRLLRQRHQTRADLVRALGWQRESVDRLFRLDHKSRLDQLEAAFAALGSTLHIDVHEAA